VSPTRLNELRNIPSGKFDLRRLIRTCEEINECYRNGCYIAVASLVRILLDHVPPVFGVRNFAEVANSAIGRSLKASLLNLETSSRKIADALLHTQIRESESLPTDASVSSSADVDVLLSEVARILRPKQDAPPPPPAADESSLRD